MRKNKFLIVFLIILLVSSFFVGLAYAETFGKTDIGGSAYTYLGYADRDEELACLFTLSEAASITSISIYLKDYNGVARTGGVYYGLFDSSKNFIAKTEAGTIPAAWGWLALDFSPAVNLSAGNYYIACLVTWRIELKYDAGGAAQTLIKYNGVTFPDFTDPFGSEDASEAWAVSIYATYTPSGGEEPVYTTATIQDTAEPATSLSSSKTIITSGSQTTIINMEQGAIKKVYMNTQTSASVNIDAEFRKLLYFASSITSTVTTSIEITKFLASVTVSVFDTVITTTTLYISKTISVNTVTTTILDTVVPWIIAYFTYPSLAEIQLTDVEAMLLLFGLLGFILAVTAIALVMAKKKQ